MKSTVLGPADGVYEAAGKAMYENDDSLRAYFGSTLKKPLDHLSDSLGWSNADRERYLTELARFFNATRVGRGAAAEILTTVARHIRPAPSEKDRTDLHEAKIGWAISTRGRLREKYDDADQADAQIRAVRQVIGQYPLAQKLFTDSGVIDSPELVLAVDENLVMEPVVRRVPPPNA